MPTYNGERFLRPAIESILEQSFRDFELIVVDDGSTDSTPRILAEWRDDRLIVLTNEQNLGIAGATNRGLAAARGEFVALQDHDDISLPHRFQTQLDFLRAHPEIALVGSAATLIDEEGVAYAEFPLPCEEIDIKWRLLFWGDAFHYTSLMVKRDAMQQIGAYSEDPAFRFSEAYDPFSRLAMRFRVTNLPERLVLWRRHSKATSLQHQIAQLHSGKIISQRNIGLLRVPGQPRPDDGDYLQYCLGFEAFTSTPPGKLPILPAGQILAGLEFFLDLRRTFYHVHRFPASVAARHQRPLNWIWGKHAIALAVRAPWDWRARFRSIKLGLRCLCVLPWLTLLEFASGQAETRSVETVPIIRPLPRPVEQPIEPGRH